MSFSSMVTDRPIGQAAGEAGDAAGDAPSPGLLARTQAAASEALVGASWPAGLVHALPILLSPERATARGALSVLVLALAFSLLAAAAAALGTASRRGTDRRAAALAGGLLAALGLGAAWVAAPTAGLVAALVLAVELARRMGPALPSGLDGLLLAAILTLRLDATATALAAPVPPMLAVVVLLVGLFAAACERQGQLVLTLDPDGRSASLLPSPWTQALPGLLVALTTGAYVAFLVAVPELRAAHGSLIFVTVPVVAAALERWRRVTERRAAVPAAGATGLPDPWLVLLLASWVVAIRLLIGPAPLA